MFDHRLVRLSLLSLAVGWTTPALAQVGSVLRSQKINELVRGFTGTLDEDDYFGLSIAALGDLNGDGVTDLAVGASLDDDGGVDRGAIWILFLNANGTLRGMQKISQTRGGFTGVLPTGRCSGDGSLPWEISTATGRRSWPRSRAIRAISIDGVGPIACGSSRGDLRIGYDRCFEEAAA